MDEIKKLADALRSAQAFATASGDPAVIAAVTALRTAIITAITTILTAP